MKSRRQREPTLPLHVHNSPYTASASCPAATSADTSGQGSVHVIMSTTSRAHFELSPLSRRYLFAGGRTAAHTTAKFSPAQRRNSNARRVQFAEEHSTRSQGASFGSEAQQSKDPCQAIPNTSSTPGRFFRAPWTLACCGEDESMSTTACTCLSKYLQSHPASKTRARVTVSNRR